MKWPAAVELNFCVCKERSHSLSGWQIGTGGVGGCTDKMQNFCHDLLENWGFAQTKSAELQSSCNDLLENCDAIKFAFVLKCKQTQCSLSGQIMNMHDLQNRFTLINLFFYSLSIINSLVPGPLLLRTQSLHSPPPTSSVGERVSASPCPLSVPSAVLSHAWAMCVRTMRMHDWSYTRVGNTFRSRDSWSLVCSTLWKIWMWCLLYIYICNKVLTSLLFRAVFVNLVNISILFAYVHL